MPPKHMENFGTPLEMTQMSRVKPFHWHKMFSEARTLVEDKQRSR
jgi:hypothetical protein